MRERLSQRLIMLLRAYSLVLLMKDLLSAIEGQFCLVYSEVEYKQEGL